MRSRLATLALISSLACTDDGPISEGVGETGDVAIEPLPGGLGCDEHWFAIDGEPVDPDDALGELAEGTLADLDNVIEFTQPAVATSHPYPEAGGDSGLAALSFEEFVSAYATPRGSSWLVERDQPMSRAQLRRLYEELRGSTRGSGSTTSPVATTFAVGGFDSSWSSGRKLALTWCLGRVMPSPSVNEEQHEFNKQRLIETVEWATRAWERASDVNFAHLDEFDSPESQGSGQCQPEQNGISFRVRTGPDCVGSCFGFSTDPTVPYNEFADPEEFETEAEIVFNLQILAGSAKETKITALHELGHVMGFTHEHLRWEDQPPGDCQRHASIPWRGVTPPDPKSVMGYDFCVGITANQPQLSAFDRLGAYYQYSWGRRRPLLMGVVSSVDDFVYDGSGRTGIVWQTPRSAQLELWTSTSEPGQAIEFAVTSRCANGGVPPCSPGFDQHGRARPVPTWLVGTATDLDILFHGPGPALPDLLATNMGQSFDPWLLDLDAYAIPVIGSYGPGVDDQILLYRPGPEQDALLVVDDGGISLIPVNYSGYAYPLPGRYRGFGGGGTTFCGMSRLPMRSPSGSGWTSGCLIFSSRRTVTPRSWA